MSYFYAWMVAAAMVPPAAVDAGAGRTLAYVLAHARAQAPALVEARAAQVEAEGRRRAAGRWLPDNPSVSGAVGRRSGADARDLELALSQPVEIAGQRGLRIAGARAGLERADAAYERVRREAVAEAARAFYRLLHAQERRALADTSEDVARRLLEAAQKRYDAGDSAALDLNLARIAFGRAQAARASTEADRLRREAELRLAAGWPAAEPLALAGRLRDAPALEAPSGTVGPELAVFEADVRQAEAALALERRTRWPALGLELRYEREEQTPVVWGGLSVALPFVRRGQEDVAAAAARLEQARGDRAAGRRRAEVAAQVGPAQVQARREAIRTLEEQVVPNVDDNDMLAARSLEVGQIGVAEFLLVRREGLEARAAYLDALLEAALADIDVWSRTGGLR